MVLLMQFIRTVPCELPPMSKWVTAECPVRVDVAGGWSDTPPITYEHGGAVVDVAITIDGKVILHSHLTLIHYVFCSMKLSR